MSNGTLQSAGVIDTPKSPGRLAAALEPMQGVCADLDSVERRIRIVIDRFIGVEPDEAAKEPQPETLLEDTLEIHIKQMAHEYFRNLERLQHQVDRMERL